MKSTCLNVGIISAFFVITSLGESTGEVIRLTLEEVQNIVSEKLVVAEKQNDAMALLEAQEAAKGKIHANAVIYIQYGTKDALAMKLEILKTADAMLNKSFDPKKRTRAGVFGKVPWPSDADRPERLRGKQLWMPRQSPEDFKEKEPELYAYYKSLYDENLRNTEEYKRQGLVRSVRSDLLRDVRDVLKKEGNLGEASNAVSQCITLVNAIIQNEQLRKEIFSNTPSGESKGNRD